MIEISHIDEPELEFGGGGRHLDIRFGIMDYGPFDVAHAEAPKRVRVGIVGSVDTVEGTTRWMDGVVLVCQPKAVVNPICFRRSLAWRMTALSTASS